MKKYLLLFCFIPLFTLAQDIYNKNTYSGMFLDAIKPVQSTLRLSPDPYRPLDSTLVHDRLAGFIKQKITYEYDNSGYRIMKQIERHYSGDIELYQIHTSFVYEKYNWIEKVDSIFEKGRYTSAEKYTRTYNEDDRLVDYRIYYKNYDAPWGDPVQIYSAVSFNDKGLPVIYMDTMVVENGSQIIHKWEILEDDSGNYYPRVENCYVEVEGEWSLEFKSVAENIGHPDLFPEIRKRIMVKDGNDWNIVSETISYPGTYHLHGFTETNASGELIQSLRYEYFYDEDWVDSGGEPNRTEDITGSNSPYISLDNLSRILEVDLGEQHTGKILIVAASGKVVKQLLLNQSQSFISLNGIQPGYYIVLVQTSVKRKSQPIIIR